MTYQVDIEPINLDEAIRDVANIDRYVLDELEATMRRSVDVIEAAVVQRTPTNTGNLRQGWGTDVQRGVSAVKGEVANPVEYALWAEKGRAAGKWPPADPIEQWVKRKLQISNEREIKQVAFLIRRAIGKRGTKGAQMAEKGLAAVRGQVELDFAAIPERVKQRVEQT